MSLRWRNWLAAILVLLLGVGLGWPHPVQAQTPAGPALDSVRVQIWPEYDRPAVLVMYDITLGSQVSLPAELSVRIPISAGQPHAVAARQANNDLINLAYTQQPVGEWIDVQFTMTTPEVHLEYYDPGLAKDGTERHFVYRWPGTYAMGAMLVQVQQPAGAQEMRLSPTLGTGTPGNDGLVYYTAEVGALAAGQTFDITVDYTKADDTLSVSNQPVAPSAPLNQAENSRPTLKSLAPFLIGGVGLALLLGGAFWYWNSGRQPAVEPAPRRRARGKAASGSVDKPAGGVSKSAGAVSGEHVYCHQCGKRAGPEDRFCRTCGAPLRH